LDLKSRKILRPGFDFKSNLTSVIGNLGNSGCLASYVSRHKAMGYDSSSFSCNNSDHGSSDDGGCGDCDGNTNRSSGGDGDTQGCSGSNGCNNGNSVGIVKVMAEMATAITSVAEIVIAMA
jgi:hypothetical protein